MKNAIVLIIASGLLIGCKSSDKEAADPGAKPAESPPMPGAQPQEPPETPAMPEQPEMPGEAAATIVDAAMATPSLSTLVSALQQAGLVETLQGEGPFTVFAPTDAAFQKLPKGTLDAVLADKDRLTKLLQHHVVKGKLSASDLGGIAEIEMLDGRKLPLNTTDGVKIAAAQVEQADIQTGNGVVHIIDTVLIPE